MEKYTKSLFLLAALLFCFSCNNSQNDSVPSEVEKSVAISSNELAENFSAWASLSGEYVDRFNVMITEQEGGSTLWGDYKHTAMLVITLENRTTGQREGFFNMRAEIIDDNYNKRSADNVYSLTALRELISVLEDIGRQISTQTCRYKTNRQYITSHGILITCYFDGSQWSKPTIQYGNDNYSSVSFRTDILSGYIDGLKSCVGFITEFKEKRWDNVSSVK